MSAATEKSTYDVFTHGLGSKTRFLMKVCQDLASTFISLDGGGAARQETAHSGARPLAEYSHLAASVRNYGRHETICQARP